MNNHLLEKFIQTRINELVLRGGLTGYDVSRMCDLPANSVYRSLRGECKISPDMQQGVCSLLGLTMSEFFEPYDAQRQCVEPVENFIAYQRLDKIEKTLCRIEFARFRVHSK